MKIAPHLKSGSGDMIMNRGQRMDKWSEHYQDLYSPENTVAVTAVEGTKILPAIEELDVSPSVDEPSKDVDSLACGRPQAMMASLRKLLRLADVPLFATTYISTCWNTGRKALYPRTCLTPTSSRLQEQT